MVAQRCTFSVGETIDGKYTILRKIGEGTFGIVYQVRDNSQRDFALKILKSWEMIPEERQKQCERFKMEFETGILHLVLVEANRRNGKAQIVQYGGMVDCFISKY